MILKTTKQIIFRLVLLLNLIPVLSVYPSALTKGIGLTPEMLTWKKFEFVNGGALIELPAKPEIHNGIYEKAFYTKNRPYSSEGDYQLSHLKVKEVRHNREKGKFFEYVKITDIEKDHVIIIRKVQMQADRIFYISSLTVLDEEYYPSPEMIEKRVKYDDEIFDRAVESIQIKGADGKYYKPKIIRLPEEIKDFTKKVKKKPVFKKANAQAVK